MTDNLEFRHIIAELEVLLEHLEDTHARFRRYLGPLSWEYSYIEVEGIKATISKLMKVCDN